MHNVPTTIWNQIAPMAIHPVWQALMAMSQVQQAAAMSGVAADLREDHVSEPVILAFLEIAPMLHEHRAIRNWLKTHPMYLGYLPEVLTTNEAILIAAKEHRLTVSQTRELRKLLDSSPETIFND